jgi:hypothetical protein
MSARSDKYITKEEAVKKLVHYILSSSSNVLEDLLNDCFGYDELRNYIINDNIDPEQVDE